MKGVPEQLVAYAVPFTRRFPDVALHGVNDRAPVTASTV